SLPPVACGEPHSLRSRGHNRHRTAPPPPKPSSERRERSDAPRCERGGTTREPRAPFGRYSLGHRKSEALPCSRSLRSRELPASFARFALHPPGEQSSPEQAGAKRPSTPGTAPHCPPPPRHRTARRGRRGFERRTRERRMVDTLRGLLARKRRSDAPALHA